MQVISAEMNQTTASDEELVVVLTTKYGVGENEARALAPNQLRIQIAALDFLANNLPRVENPA